MQPSQIQQRINSINEDIAKFNDQISIIQGRINRLIKDREKLQESLAPYSLKVLGTHRNLMDYFRINYASVGVGNNANFVVPYVPTNFNVRISDNGPGSIHSGNNDYSACIFPYSIGSDSYGALTFIDLYGYFAVGRADAPITENTRMFDILNSGRYVLKRIGLPAESIYGEMRDYDITPSTNLSTIVSGRASANIFSVVNRLTQWMRKTAFLCPLELCQNYWWDTFGDGIMPPYNIVNSNTQLNLSVQQTPSVSSRDPIIVLPNILQKKYYDRLFDFMTITKLNETRTLNLLKSRPF